MKNSGDVTIRLETVEEVDRAFDVIREVAKEEDYLMEDGVEQSRIDLTKELLEHNGDDVLFIVAEVDGRIVGTLDLVKYGRYGKTAHVRYLDMAIIDGYRSIGIGSALMDFAVNWAREKKFRKILLDVFSTHTRAINLYRKFGFQIEGTKKDVVMIRNRYADLVSMGLTLIS